MRVAVVIETELSMGGGFQHEFAVASLLHRHNGRELEFYFFTTVEQNVFLLKQLGITATLLQFPLGARLRHRFHQIKAMLVPPLAVPSPQSPLDEILETHEIDLVFFPSPSPLALELRGHNYIFSVWDLCHLDHPEFPEVNFGNQFEAREHLYQNALCKAVSVIVDSKHGKANLLLRYKVDPERVAVLPFLPPNDTVNGDVPTSEFDVKKRYEIPGDYLFYPAQFWAHKNHIYILKALKMMVERGAPLHAVFSGADKGNLALVLEMAARLRVSELVHYIGFVDGCEIPFLYRQALSLVMPTYFGPTNIPALEAFHWGCPVCYSDLPGLRDQVGEAAFLLDLERPETLVEALQTIRSKPAVVAEKKRHGEKILASWNEEHYWLALNFIFERYRSKMQSWKLEQ